MVRWLAVLAALFSLLPAAPDGQTLSVLHIKVVLVDAERKPMPVPRYALLISDNPATEAPRRVVTGLDGTADVRLRPGNYTVESDLPLAFEGKAYEWTQTLDVVAGRDATLVLTAENADVAAAGAAASTTSIPPLESDSSWVLAQWQQSVVELWTPTAHAAGFVIGADGLVATNQRGIGAADSIEVQFSPAVKVAGRVLVADAARDVAVLWIDPATAASVRPVPLGCAPAAAPAVANGQKISSIDAPLRQPKDATVGAVSNVAPHAIESDMVLGPDGAGGPVFTVGGVVGLTTVVDDRSGRRRGSARIVPVADVCEAVASARQKMKDAALPSGVRLPVEPSRPFPVDALEAAVKGRAGSLNPYHAASTDFDIAFVTPVLTYGAQHLPERMNRPESGSGGTRARDTPPVVVRPPSDFGSWSEYVEDLPPVLLVRVTPKLVESFWTKVARGAAVTQGIAVPAIKRFKTGFLRMRALCGDAEIAPVHPFRIERRVSETDAVYEGLYVFDPGALAPSCGSVKLVLYSEKAPDKGETQIVDAKVIEQIWRDFEPYRSPK